MPGPVSNDMKSKTIGRDSSCDLILEHSGISRLHGRVELNENGLICLQDADSSNGLFLKRNDSWIRIRKITLCIGDRIRFGELDVPLEQLTAVFGSHSKVRLEARHFQLRNTNKGTRSFADLRDAGSLLQKPRRNPVTGKIEDDSPV
jgi:pSer/pThr/pTyr-binding forkhead associated (FHA) protein